MFVDEWIPVKFNTCDFILIILNTGT